METDPKIQERYQQLLQDLNAEALEKLRKARVLVIGAGRLGFPLLQYLAAAGTGTLGLIDQGSVDTAELQRRLPYTAADTGRLRADCAAESILAQYPALTVVSYPLKISTQNTPLIFSKYDLILDCTGNLPAHYMISDACRLLGLSLVYGAAWAHEGQVAVFNVHADKGSRTAFRDIFPDPLQHADIPEHRPAGIDSVLPGMIAQLQAAEAIKLLTGAGTGPGGRLLVYKGDTQQLSDTLITCRAKGTAAMAPADLDAFLHTDYQAFCGLSAALPAVREITAAEFAVLKSDPGYTVIDVREEDEQPAAAGFSYLNIPLSALQRQVPELKGRKFILFCQSGARSMTAGELLLSAYPEKEFYSLKGGLLRLS